MTDNDSRETRVVTFTLTSRANPAEGVPFSSGELRAFTGILSDYLQDRQGAHWSFGIGPVTVSDPSNPVYHAWDGTSRRPIQVGDILYDNNLDVVRITELAYDVQHNWNTGENVAWHRHVTLVRWNGSEPGRVGSSDCDRLGFRHPVTGELARDHAIRAGAVTPA